MPTTTVPSASALIDRVLRRPWGLVGATVVGDDIDVAVQAGDDPLSETSLVQIGSVTKTMTGLLLAQSVLRGEVTLDTTAGDLLGSDAGSCRAVTLRQLATHASGLPRLQPNLVSERTDLADPYAHYGRADLLEVLAAVPAPTPGAFEYSNFGYTLLGCLLEEAAGESYAGLLQQRVFEPLGMAGAFCGLPAEGQDAVPGYAGGTVARWWDLPLPAAGGVACDVRDFARYVWAHANPGSTPLQDALELVTQVHGPGQSEDAPIGLGWMHRSGAHWHNGGTGGFHSFAAFHRPTRTAVALVANAQDAVALDAVGAAALAELSGKDAA